MTTLGSENQFPKLYLTNSGTTGTPAAGLGKLYVDSSKRLVYIDDTGASVILSSGLTDPMTTRGDMIIRNASNVTARLGRGTAAQVLTSDGTDIAWATPTSGFADPMTSRGDMIIRNAANATARLAKGTAGQRLTSDGTDIAWGSTTTADGTLAGDVTMTTASTWYDGPTISCVAGTWLIIANLLFTPVTAATQAFYGRIMDATPTYYDERAFSSNVSSAFGVFPLSMAAIITLGSTTTIKAQGTSARNGDKITREIPANSNSTHTASRISGVKL